jgi:hypothetical protein
LRFTGPPAQAAADATRMHGTYQEHVLLFSCVASQNLAHPDSAKHRPQHETQGNCQGCTAYCTGATYAANFTLTRQQPCRGAYYCC